jgi:hypothetical protein
VIDLEAANAAFEDSAVGRVAVSAIDRFMTASRESTVVARVRALSLTVVPAEPGARLRWWATTFGWAMLAHLAIHAGLPRYASPGLPWWWQVAAAAFAFTVAAAAGSIATGWQQARLARLWRGLTN